MWPSSLASMILRAALVLLSVVAYVSSQAPPAKTVRFASPTSSAYIRQSDGAFVRDNYQFEFAHVLRDDGSGYIRLLLLKSIHNAHRRPRGSPGRSGCSASM